MYKQLGKLLTLQGATRWVPKTSRTTVPSMTRATARMGYSSLTERKLWSKKRFGEVPEDILGSSKELKPMVWPKLVETYPLKSGQTANMRMLENIEDYAPRVAEIYQKAIDEMVGNTDYEWHHDPKQIVEKVRAGDTYRIYGYFLDKELIGVGSLCMLKGQRAIQWVWGAVDPDYRGAGMWKPVAEYNDKLIASSGAQMGLLWVATTHPFSQMSVEAVGYRPWGIFPGGEFLGGSDEKWYRQTVVWYAKPYGESAKNFLPWDKLKLTKSAQLLANQVQGLWKSETNEVKNNHEEKNENEEDLGSSAINQFR